MLNWGFPQDIPLVKGLPLGKAHLFTILIAFQLSDTDSNDKKVCCVCVCVTSDSCTSKYRHEYASCIFL